MESARRKGISSKRKTAAPRRTKRSLKVVVGGRPSGVVETYVERIRRAAPSDLMDMEREGVPGALIKDLGRGFHFTQQRFYEILGAPKATVERKTLSSKPVAGTVGQATLGVVRLLALAEGIVARSTAPEAKGFDTQRWLGEWLETPQPALGGRRPSEMLDTPTGIAIVEKTLGAIESGSYL
ncbi:MAG TPA: antitoxin Xre/MbcA/ParS toxin-binding domain-containing protein [Usitatibacter sp.]|nr:antitoxin Xre/MbcA/ParS toxin-binding domain-containing protein [Usitatibacter sp.]